MDRGAWRAAVDGVAKSQTQLSQTQRTELMRNKGSEEELSVNGD